MLQCKSRKKVKNISDRLPSIKLQIYSKPTMCWLECNQTRTNLNLQTNHCHNNKSEFNLKRYLLKPHHRIPQLKSQKSNLPHNLKSNVHQQQCCWIRFYRHQHRKQSHQQKNNNHHKFSLIKNFAQHLEFSKRETFGLQLPTFKLNNRENQPSLTISGSSEQEQSEITTPITPKNNSSRPKVLSTSIKPLTWPIKTNRNPMSTDPDWSNRPTLLPQPRNRHSLSQASNNWPKTWTWEKSQPMIWGMSKPLQTWRNLQINGQVSMRHQLRKKVQMSNSMDLTRRKISRVQSK